SSDLVDGEAKSRARNEQKHCVGDQPPLPPEGKKSPHCETGTPHITMCARQRPSHLLEGRKSITRDAKLGEKGFDPGLVSACKGEIGRSGGSIEHVVGKARTPGFRLVETAFFGLKLAAARVKRVKGFTRVRERI